MINILAPLKIYEKVIVVALTLLMVLLIAHSTLKLALAVGQSILTPPFLDFQSDLLLEMFGLFLLVLLGIELLETLTAYLRENVVHVEVVMLVALIAVTRKIIILDVKSLPGVNLIGLAVLLLALAYGYRLIRKAHNERDSGRRSPPP